MNKLSVLKTPAECYSAAEQAALAASVRRLMRADRYVYFKAIEQSNGVEAVVDGQPLIMVSSNDYLGLTHDRRVIAAATKAIRRWGSGPGGSRFLCGNLTLHHELEESLADFVGKAGALVHPTGFLTNAGVIACLARPGDVLLCDRECHASILAGCRLAGVRMVSYKGEKEHAAQDALERLRAKPDTGRIFLITEGLFSMSGRVTDLAALTQLRSIDPKLFIYVDDAHGLGVMGGGRTTAHQFNAVKKIDMVMGTFSKALASIGGFVATDDRNLLTFIQHDSRTHIFSAGLPAANAAAALKSLEIIRAEPQRVERLWKNAHLAQAGLRKLGLTLRETSSPINAIVVGDEMAAFDFSQDLFRKGVFALPAIYPAVPKGQAILRVVFTSKHSRKHINKVLEAIAETARRFRLIEK
mgnify:CR=1 FL=1